MNNGKKKKKNVLDRNIEWYTYTWQFVELLTFIRLILIRYDISLHDFFLIWDIYAWIWNNINCLQLINSLNNSSQNQNLKSTFKDQKEKRIAVDDYVKSDNFCKTKCPFRGFELNTPIERYLISSVFVCVGASQLTST